MHAAASGPACCDQFGAFTLSANMLGKATETAGQPLSFPETRESDKRSFAPA
jgi:hypothetical protein